MNTMLFQPPHYAKANEIVQVFSQDKKNPKTFRGFSYPTYVDIREQNSVFSGVMAHNLAMVGAGRERQHAARVHRRRELQLFLGHGSDADARPRVSRRKRKRPAATRRSRS